MKKFSLAITLILSLLDSHSQTQQLNGVTFGFGAGYSRLGKNPYQYSLSTDDEHILQLQKLSRGSFVISSVVSVKFGKIGVQQEDGVNGGEKIVNLKKLEMDNKNIKKDAKGKNVFKPAEFFNRLSVNLALNLVEISGENVSFNKNIDGGLGLGYFLNEYIQVAFFYDIIRIRQMQDDIVKKYEGKSIPNGTENFNALDQNNNDLFYNKTFGGFSVKVIFSLANKKASD